MSGDRRTLKIGFVTERMLLGFGVDLVIDRIASGLVERGHSVKVFSSLVDDTYRKVSYQIEPIPTRAFDFFPLYEASALRKLKILNSQDIDVFLIETFPYYALLPWLKKPAIAVDNGVCPTTGFSTWKRLNFKYMAKAQYLVYFRFADRICTISEFVKGTLPRRLHGKTEVVYLGVDHYRTTGDRKKTRQTVRQKHGIKDDEVLLLYVGRLNPEGQPYKGMAELLDIYQKAIKANSKIRLMAVGLGSAGDAAMLRQQEVIPRINAPVSEMPSFYLASDVFVTGSQWEGFDLPLTEAQYFGRPGVAFRIGAHPEVVVDGQTAFLASDREEFLEAVLRLAGDADLRTKMGEAAGRLAARFYWQRTVDEYEKIIKEVVL